MELINITYAGPGNELGKLNVKDRNLINVNYINSSFGQVDDYIELFIYDENNNLLLSDYEAFDYYPYLQNNPQNNTYSALSLDPEKDLKNRGFNRGNLNIQYNFYKKLFNSSANNYYWIKEISRSRTELKLSSQTLSNDSIRSSFSAYQSYISTNNYYPVFYLNFGNNQIIVANNVAYTEDDEGGYLLVKLYEPLPTNFDLKNQLWIVDKISEPVSFNVSIQVEADEIQDVNRLRGANYNVQINNKNGQTTPYYTYNNLLTSPISSSFQKLSSYYDDKAVAINVDYSDFKNFIHFSSAVERVSNFVYKLQLIETASRDIITQKSIVGAVGTLSATSASVVALQSQIDNLIKNFDPYEYFLYFESSSWAWPKSTSTQPYTLYSVTSSQALNFLGATNIVSTSTTQSLLFSASYYDTTNKDILRSSIPQYLLDDSNNTPYLTFIDMVGQHFDNIWLYYKDLSNRYNATNNPDTGISLDIVADALRGFGIELYTNSNISDNLYYTLFGINPDGSLLPPTGSERITNYITSSLMTLSAKNIQGEFYKRLYHNLPYLLKTKGTERGVKALISTFGIPEDILTVREFGNTPINSVDGIFDLDSSTYKILIATGSNGNVTGSLTLSSSLLSPYTTIQYYQNLNRSNINNIEVGFSPSDIINANITSSLGFFNIDQLIGNPNYQYSSSYNLLISASNSYFTSYNKPNSVWEYIRLIKFYNNSLFKMIKDFVPARANLSTGIIVKSHMLERNKYARHEPSASLQNYSQSIDSAFITASSGGSIINSTSYTGSLITPLGSVTKIYSDGLQRYTGEFSGSNIVVTTGKASNQNDYSNRSSITGSNYPTRSFGALYQNVTASVRSLQLFDLDYNADQLKPVNYGIITQSISSSQVDNYATYTNPNSPYARVQDYNYNLKRSTIPRYEGSKTISSTYTTFTNGDQSYGKTAAIDKIKYQYGYLVDIYSASAFLPNRSNAQIKYLIDNNENVLDLTKANKNIFEVQNVYKSGETVNISLFNYNEDNPYTQQLANNPTLQIYEGGWRYLPILHNISGSATSQRFSLSNPTQVSITQTAASALDPNSPFLQAENWNVYWWSEEVNIINSGQCSGISNYTLYISASYIPGTNAPVDITLTVSTPLDTSNKVNPQCSTVESYQKTITISSGKNSGVSSQYGSTLTSLIQNGGNGSSDSDGTNWPKYSARGECLDYPVCSININSISAGTIPGGGVTSTYTYYTSEFTSSQACLYYLSQSNEIIFNSTMSYYYNNRNTAPIYFNSTSDTNWAGSGLPPAILPFTLEVGDKISFYSTASLGWSELNEYTIKNVRISGSADHITSSVILVEVDKPVNLIFFQSASSIPLERITGAPFRSCRYIVWKHVPDETNVMLRYNPRDNSLVENGILFPQYIDTNVRDNAGNVIKALKQQNLIE